MPPLNQQVKFNHPAEPIAQVFFRCVDVFNSLSGNPNSPLDTFGRGPARTASLPEPLLSQGLDEVDIMWPLRGSAPFEWGTGEGAAI